MFGYCTRREDFRVFKLNRLWELSVTSDAFTPREIPPDRLDLGSSLADTNEAKILFDPSVRYRLIEEYGFKSFTETEDGRLLQEYPCDDGTYYHAELDVYGQILGVTEARHGSDYPDGNHQYTVSFARG